MEKNPRQRFIAWQVFPGQDVVQFHRRAQGTIGEVAAQPLGPIHHLFLAGDDQLAVLHLLGDPVVFVAMQVFDPLHLVHQIVRLLDSPPVQPFAQQFRLLRAGEVIALYHTPHALGGQFVCVRFPVFFVQLNENEAATTAVPLVQRKDCMSSCTRSGKAVQNQAVWSRRDCQDFF